MKNTKIVTAWNKLNPDKETSLRMQTALLERLENHKRRKPYFSKGFLFAATLSMVLLITFVFNNQLNYHSQKMAEIGTDSDYIGLTLSDNGVKVSYTGEVLMGNTSYELVYLSEEELLNGFEAIIFSGTIQSMRNIKIEYGQICDYRAIAIITADEVLRGNIDTGTAVSVLLNSPAADGENYWVEETETEVRMKPGSSGIFIAVVCTMNTKSEVNGRTLYYLDLADYFFPDGSRFAFLETETGLYYFRDAYPGLA